MQSDPPLEPPADTCDDVAGGVEASTEDRIEARIVGLEMRGAGQVEETRREARAWLAEVPRHAGLLRRRLELLIAVGDTRLGDFEHGAARVRAIREWASGPDGDVLLHARAERQLAMLLRRAGEMTSGLEHAVASVELLREDDPALLRADHLLGLADALSMVGSDQEALQRYSEALAIAQHAGDEEFLLRVINNTAYSYYELGRISEALPLCEQMVEMQTRGHVLSPYALSTLADTYLAAGLPDRAEEVLSAVVLDEQTPVEDVVDTLLSRARIQRAFGHHQVALDLLDEVLAAAQGQGFGELTARALREQAELSAEIGDFELAYRRFVSYHDQSIAHHRADTAVREAMSRAMVEVTQARRESAAYREMSYRDALTELHNRRYVDEHLDALLERTISAGEPFTAAFVDLDHFKRINDTWSHDVGDRVLQTVARLLARAIDDVDGAVTARMGGEEFLVVLPAITHDAAVRRLEHLRAAVQGHIWDALAPGARVTVSIGVSHAGEDGTERLGLLSTADRRLYDAKRAGRNRVVVRG